MDASFVATDSSRSPHLDAGPKLISIFKVHLGFC